MLSVTLKHFWRNPKEQTTTEAGKGIKHPGENSYYQLTRLKNNTNIKKGLFIALLRVRKLFQFPIHAFVFYLLLSATTKPSKPPHPHRQQLSYPSRLHTHHSDSFENLLTMTFGKYKPISIQLNKHTMLTFSKRSERSFL